MAFAKVGDEELAEKLSEIFQRLGYEAASLGLIAKATGLEKASLYHRFRRGKEEMVSAAVAQIGAKFGREVIAPLAGPGTPKDKLRLALRGLRDFYRDGKLPCALDTLSLVVVNPAFTDVLRDSYTAWLEAFTTLAREAGFSAANAKQRAQHAIILIEGSLVVSRVTGDVKPFRQAVASLPNILLNDNSAE